MASASSKSARNLFADSKRRLAERVQVNVNNAGSVARATQRLSPAVAAPVSGGGGRSAGEAAAAAAADPLAAAARGLAASETATEASFDGLQRAQVLSAQLSHAQKQLEHSLAALAEIRDKAQDMRR